ncbi:MAG: ATPase, partial [Bacteroidetes bacterium]|nr:ATPase [Bacteroidota bacterium]
SAYEIIKKKIEQAQVIATKEEEKKQKEKEAKKSSRSSSSTSNTVTKGIVKVLTSATFIRGAMGLLLKMMKK